MNDLIDLHRALVDVGLCPECLTKLRRGEYNCPRPECPFHDDPRPEVFDPDEE